MGDTKGLDDDVSTRVGGAKLTSRFIFKHSLGVGGMGEVYLAEDSSLRRPVAIKTIRADLSRNPEVRRRIERECLLHAKVGPHPHIVTLFDKIEEDGRLNLVMEYVEGETLQQLLEGNQKEGTALPLGDAVAIAKQVLDALGRIHAQGIVHRDIKPSNIILTRDDSGAICAKLMDFGIARGQDDEFASRLTQESGSGPGTPLYMAPEQIDSDAFGEVSPATDVYAMGVMLYQMTSGEPPFKGSITQIFNGHLRSTPPSLRDRARGRVPEILAEIVECALAKNPASRFPTAKAFREELLNVAASPAGACASSEMTLPSRKAAPMNDPAMTLRADAVSSRMDTVGSTQLAGSARASGAGRRGSRAGLVFLLFFLLVVAAAVVAAAWFFLPGLLKGNDNGSGKEEENKPAATTDAAAPVDAPPAAPAGVTPPAGAPGAGPEALPDGFSAAPALPPDAAAPAPSAAAPAAPAPAPTVPAPAAPAPAPAPAPVAPAAVVPDTAAPAPQDNGASAMDILNQGLEQRQATEPPAPAPEPPATAPAAAEPPKTEPAKTEKPKPAKQAKPKAPEVKTEPKTEAKPAELAPAPTPPPASAWQADSLQSRKIR